MIPYEVDNTQVFNMVLNIATSRSMLSPNKD